MQEKSADCGKNGTFLVESQKPKVESKEGGERDGERADLDVAEMSRFLCATFLYSLSGSYKKHVEEHIKKCCVCRKFVVPLQLNGLFLFGSKREQAKRKEVMVRCRILTKPALFFAHVGK